MNTIEVKIQLHQFIDLADERMAKALLALFQNYFTEEKDTENKPVIFTAKGKELTKAQIIAEVTDAVESVNSGNYLTAKQIAAR